MKLFFSACAVSLIFYGSLVSASSNMTTSCVKFYNNESKNILERFKKTVDEKHDQFLPLVVNEFVSLEIDHLLARYEHIEKTLGIADSHSDLTARLSTFNEHSTTISGQIDEVKKLLGSATTQKKSLMARLPWLNSEQKTKAKLQEVTDRLALCRSNMDTCAIQLKDNVNASAEALFQIEVLVREIEIKINELNELKPYLETVRQFNTMSNDTALAMIENGIGRLDRSIDMAKILYKAHSEALVLAQISLENDPRTIDRQIDHLLAKGAPEVLRDWKDAKTKPKMEMKTVINHNFNNPLMGKIETLFKSNTSDQIKSATLHEMIVKAGDSFTSKEAVFILEQQPFAKWGSDDNHYTLKFYKSLSNKWSGWIPFYLLIAYEIAKRTIPSDPNTDARFISLLSSTFERYTKENNFTPEYRNDLSGLLSKLIYDFQSRQ